MNNLIPIEFNKERILTTQQLAEEYETETRRISENFNSNKDRYIAGIHYFCLQGDDLKGFKREYGNSVVADNLNKFYLWTEKGALLHAKSLNTDKAWEKYSFLVEAYFRARDMKMKLDELSPQLQLLIQLKQIRSNRLARLRQRIDE